MAYAPAADVRKWMGWKLGLYRFMLPGAVDFITQSSPATHVGSLKKSIFLFHAEDDSICPISGTRDFADKLQKQGTDVKFVTVKTGDHYDSMINEGIPAAIQWLKDQQAIQ